MPPACPMVEACNLGTLRILINRMTLDLINQKMRMGFTPLDRAHFENSSPLKEDIIKLIRSHGGKPSPWHSYKMHKPF